MPWEVQTITEQEKRNAERLLSQIHFLFHKPLSYEWAGGIVIDGQASVNVIVQDEGGHVNSHYLRVPVKWNLPPTEEQENVLALLRETINDQNALLHQLEEIPEVLGNAEDILIDDAAMALLQTSIENLTAQIKRIQNKLQHALGAENSFQ